MDDLEKKILKEVAELDSLPVGAFNIRNNGKSEARNSTANIDIESREDGQGINIYIKDGTKNESCHIPVIISKSGHKETVYNEFFIGEDCDVVIVAGCGISNCCGQDSRHDGVHSFHVGRNSRLKYIEKQTKGCYYVKSCTYRPDDAAKTGDVSIMITLYYYNTTEIATQAPTQAATKK